MKQTESPEMTEGENMSSEMEPWEKALGRIEEKISHQWKKSLQDGRNTLTEKKLKIRTRGIPNKYLQKGFDDYVESRQPEAFKAAIEYVYPEKGIVFCGTPGTGKTHLACSILKSITDERQLEGCFNVVPEMLSEMNERAQNGGSKIAMIKEIAENDVILLDDLTDTNLTEAKKENLFLLLNRLELEDRVVFITSNMMPEAMQKLGSQIYSRIMELCSVVVMIGKDARVNKLEFSN